MVRELTKMEELKEILNSDDIYCIDCFADWCGPCRMVQPKFHELSKKYPKVHFKKVNVENKDMVEFCKALDVHSLPTFYFIQGSDILDEVRGADINAVEKALKNILNEQ